MTDPQPLETNCRPIDHARAERLTLAWTTADHEALILTLREMVTDHGSDSGVLMSVVEMAAAFGKRALPDQLEDVLRSRILEHTQQQDAMDAAAPPAA